MGIAGFLVVVLGQITRVAEQALIVDTNIWREFSPVFVSQADTELEISKSFGDVQFVIVFAVPVDFDLR